MVDPKNNIVIVSHCHRQVDAFSMTCKHLVGAGYDVIIHDTSGKRLINPPAETTLLDAGAHLGYDGAMINIKRTLQLGLFEYIVFLDNDLFLTGISHFQEYLEEFDRRDFDFACHFEYPGYYENYTIPKGGCIARVRDQQTFPTTDIKPIPHWENSYMIMRTEAYDQLTEEDISHGRRWLHAMSQKGFSLGAHYCNYKLRYSHYGPEWFHMGNLMGCYGRIETGNFHEFDVNSSIEASRLGFMYLDNPSLPGLDTALHLFGKQRCLDEWTQLAKGTCMENWNV